MAVIIQPHPDIEAQSVAASYSAGYHDGDAAGYRRGWHTGVRQARATDVAFISGIADELRRRELEDEADTSEQHQWIADLLESMKAEALRDQWDRKVRAERHERGRAA